MEARRDRSTIMHNVTRRVVNITVNGNGSVILRAETHGRASLPVNVPIFFRSIFRSENRARVNPLAAIPSDISDDSSNDSSTFRFVVHRFVFFFFFYKSRISIDDQRRGTTIYRGAKSNRVEKERKEEGKKGERDETRRRRR